MIVNASGFVVDVIPQPATVTECSLVLASPSEIGSSPFALTVEEGGMVGAAIMLLWGAAFGLRTIRRALD